MSMTNIVFKPWIGKDYETGGIFGKRILVLGESHYGFTNEEDATNKVVNYVISGGSAEWTGTFRKFERSLVGHYTDNEESKKIWNSVAFYNYLQNSMNHPRQSPKESDFDSSSNAFYKVMNQLKPDLIIAWGITHMYWFMPGEGWTVGAKLLYENKKDVPNGYYTLDSGKRIRVIWVKHPSAAYSWDKWYKVIKNEIH